MTTVGLRERRRHGICTLDVKNSLKTNKGTDVRKVKTDEDFTENIGLPPELLEEHTPWPAYVTYTCPMVKRLIRNSKARELECMRAFEENQRALKQKKPSSVIQLKGKKSSKLSGKMVFSDMKSETMLSLWRAFSLSTIGPTVLPEPIHFHMDTREGPTENYNKIIFPQKPMMKMLPHSSLLASKEKHSNV
ncbi:CMT1A duplicated region transcript 4 protein [Pteronotus mesoamericanus]|uniref:CMT1A duplicated region transcript 4 protein n=1 Tax=Pteronotus mesoamericanus TaxID=1884717 RepID=UPI0023ED10CF|nr:CMT1A duplicated region transcript 4 protein [Pteronotus parnellii mesoamericanus]